MTNILNSYIPKFLVNLNRFNEDVITVSTRYFSPQGDVYELDKRTISPNVIQTTQSLAELKPEVSDTYPFKIVPPKDFDGSTLIQTPGIGTFPTASQNYYIPLYFERYNESIVRQINRSFQDTAQLIPDIVILSLTNDEYPNTTQLVAQFSDVFGNGVTTPLQQLNWVSSDVSKATVDPQGNVRAVSIGTCGITVTKDNLTAQSNITIIP